MQYNLRYILPLQLLKLQLLKQITFALNLARRLLLLFFLCSTFFAVEFVAKYQIISATKLYAKEQGFVSIEGIKGEKKISVDIVRTPSERNIGLSNRKELPENYGMLFLYSYPTKVVFWMKDTYIALDLIFINKNLQVTSISKNNQPLDLSQIVSKVPVIAVLEVLAGQADKLGVDVDSIINNSTLREIASGLK